MSKRRALNGRAAAKADHDAEEVIFYIEDGRSVPYQSGRDLPLSARVISSEEATRFPFWNRD